MHVEHFSELDADELAARVGRQVRLQRGLQQLTAADLAERSGLSRTIVAKIERGDGNPSLGTLWRLSRTLRIPIGELIGDEPEPRTRVVRAGEGAAIADPSGMAARLLHADGRERRSEVFAIELPAGARRESAAHFRGVEELLVITAGHATAGPDGGAERLGPGDALWFAADVPHHYEATAGPVALLCWMFYPPASA